MPTKPPATRNFHPLPFEHLEPKRFEDLVRQLAYDLRPWKALEAIGRQGGDEGNDIRGTERVANEDINEADDEENEVSRSGEERTWLIQCKRESAIGPTRARKIVSESFPEFAEIPFGYVLAASTDLSLKARAALREELVVRGVQEFLVWGAAELEDMLYQPKNDHLLFAYFGISIQIRARSKRTELRSAMTLKRQLVKAVGDIQSTSPKAVLLRDVNEPMYPLANEIPDFAERRPWAYYEFQGHEPVGHLLFRLRRYFAYYDRETGEWDMCELVNDARSNLRQIAFYEDETEDWNLRSRIRKFWSRLPVQKKAWGEIHRTVPYDHVLLVDEIGDMYHEGPHLLVDYDSANGPFASGYYLSLRTDAGWDRDLIVPDDEKRINFFPKDSNGFSEDEAEDGEVDMVGEVTAKDI
ncbi:MAG: hypothetical protein EON58_01950 [Alphaproteobacteria bacterium]|nr:MAG: hypothetical protein EON58_01950 [Alphaproteobacteria bacterium]